MRMVLLVVPVTVTLSIALLMLYGVISEWPGVIASTIIILVGYALFLRTL